MEFSRPEYWSGYAFPSLEDLPNPGIKPMSPTLWADSLPAEPQGKPKNIEMGSLSLLQQIFPTQESNQGLLHCRQIRHQLRYQGSFTLKETGKCNKLDIFPSWESVVQYVLAYCRKDIPENQWRRTSSAHRISNWIRLLLVLWVLKWQPYSGEIFQSLKKWYFKNKA